MQNARESALLALYEIEYSGAYSNIALKNILKNSELDQRDKAFTTALVYGVLSKKLYLDYIISEFSTLKLNKISKYILLILRMGIYQIKFMDKVPESAAVNESVRLAKRYGHKASSGFVNGILRTVTKEEMTEPKDLYIVESFAKENAERLYKDYGKRASAIMSALNNEPKMTLRVNTLKTTKDKLKKLLKAEDVPYSNKALYLKNTDLSESPEYKMGYFTVQDISPMIACDVLAPRKSETVLDMCASPGGKTTYMAEIMENEGKILAFDIHPHRTELIRHNKIRLGIDIIQEQTQDATVLNERLIETADKVLLDVPCSGIGIAKRKPELKYKTEFDGLSEIQYRILENSAKYLKKGGELVYSTCTLYKEENEQVVEKFLKENKGYSLVSFKELLPEGFFEDKAGMMTVLPDKIDADGFFVAKIRRDK